MGTTLLRIAPIHIQATEVALRVRLRLLRPISFNSFELTSTPYLFVLPFTTKLPGSSFGNRAYLPERSVLQCIQIHPYGFPLSNQHLGVASSLVVQFCSQNLGFYASCLTTQSKKNFWISFLMIA